MAASPAGAQSVSRALKLFDFVCRSADPVALDEASAWIGLPKSTTCRLLQALTVFGLVAQDETTRAYRPGLRLFELYNLSVDRLDLFQEARPGLRRLSNQFNETVHLGILDSGQVVYVDKEESSRAVRMFSAIGKRAPAHCTGLGKALLAHLEPDAVAQAISQHGLPGFTPRTIVDMDDLLEELDRIRIRGYALDEGEHEEDIRCVAAPIHNAAGTVVAALSLTMPAGRFACMALPELADGVRASADEISARLGHVGVP